MYDEAEAADAYSEEREAADDQEDTTPADSGEDEQPETDSGEEYAYGNRTADLLAEHIMNTGPGDDPVQTAIETVLHDAWNTYNASGSEDEADSGSEDEAPSGESEEQ